MSGDLIAQSLLLNSRQRPRQSASSRLAEQLMRQAGQQGPVYGTMGVLSRALPGVLGAYMAQRGDREERDEQRRSQQELMDYQQRQQDEFRAIVGGSPQAPQMPAQAPMMPPGGDMPPMPQTPSAVPQGALVPARGEAPQEVSQGIAERAALDRNAPDYFDRIQAINNRVAGATMRGAPQPVVPSAMPPGGAPQAAPQMPGEPDWPRIQLALRSGNPMAVAWARNEMAVAQAMRREAPAPETFSPPQEGVVDGRRALVQYGNRGTVRPVQGVEPPDAAPRAPSAAQERIDLMMQNGVPIEMARGVVAGQFVERQDPQDGTITIFDRTSGRVLFGPNAGGIIGQPVAPGRVGGASILPPDADYRGSFGAPGVVSEALNSVVDLFGGTNLPEPRVAQATQALEGLRMRTLEGLQKAFGGRPTNLQLQIIEGLIPTPARLRLGPERAYERVEQTREMVARSVRELEQVASMQGTGTIRGTTISEANVNLIPLRNLLADYDVLLRSMGAASGRPEQNAPPPPAGVDPRVWGEMTPEERALWQN